MDAVTSRLTELELRCSWGEIVADLGGWLLDAPQLPCHVLRTLP
jgi:hypothetical protein